MTMRLYDYFRSSAAYRVRIAVHLKGLEVGHEYVHLRRGEQTAADYLAVNPQGLVPALVTGDGAVLSQSLAIIEYLEEIHPAPPLLPADPPGRARVRAMALIVACEVHPLQNLRVRKWLADPLGLSPETVNTRWAHHWMAEGLGAIEAMLAGPATGAFCHGDTPGLADACIVPQVFNCEVAKFDLAPYPKVMAITERCRALAPFKAAHPDTQPDAEPR